MEMVSRSVEETMALGARLGAALPGGSVVALRGGLGAGKTHFVRGLAQGAQVADPDLVNSPTYVLLNIYEAQPGNPASRAVYHLDAYRVRSGEDFAAVGLEELLQEGAITVIEWPERIEELLPAERVEVRIEVVDERTREIVVEENAKLKT